MKGIFNNSTFLKIFSLIVALLLWIYVADGQNPIEDKLFDVEVEFINLPDDLAVSQVSTVKVRVEGNKQVIEDLLARDIVATVDLTNAAIGRQTEKIQVSLPSNVQLVSVNPLDLFVDVQKIATQQSKVKVLYDSGTATSDTAAVTVLTPEEVVISGPQDVIKSIAKIYVKVKSSELDGNYQASLPVQVEDAQGQNLNSLLDIQPTDVAVFIPALSGEPTKVVAVQVPLSGSPAEGYMVTRVAISPNTATIQGDYWSLDKINTLQTTAVDIAGAKNDITMRPALVPPDGADIVSDTTINVVVKIEPKIRKTLNNVAITIKNPADNFQYALDESTVNVTLEGPRSLVEDLTAADVAVFCDVDGATFGQKVYHLEVDCASGISVYSLDPGQVTVTISRMQK